MSNIIHTLQQNVRLGTRVSVVIKTGHTYVGTLASISMTDITLDIGGSPAVIAADALAFCSPEQPAAPSATASPFTNPLPSPPEGGSGVGLKPVAGGGAEADPVSAPAQTNLDARPAAAATVPQPASQAFAGPDAAAVTALAHIEARFAAQISTVRLEALELIEVIDPDELAHLPYQERRRLQSLWDSCRQQYRHARTIREPSRYNQTIFGLRQIIEIDPELWQAHYNAGCLYLALEANLDARTYFHAARQLSRQPICLHNLAAACLKLGDFQGAYDALSNLMASEKPTRDVTAWYTLVKVGRQLRAAEFLVPTYENAVRAKSAADLQLVLETLSFLLCDSGHRDTAAEILSALPVDSPEVNRFGDFGRWLALIAPNLPAPGSRVAAAAQTTSPTPGAPGKPGAPLPVNGAQKPLVPRLGLSKGQIRSKLEEAQRLARSQQYNFAIAAIRSVLEQEPGNEIALALEQDYINKEKIRTLPSGTGPYRLAKEAEQIHNSPEQAERYYRQAIKVGDRYESAVKDLAMALSRAGRDNEAIGLLLEHKRKFSNQVPLLQVLTTIYQKSGRHREAVPVLQAIAGMTGGERALEVLRRLAISCLKAEMFTEAEAALQSLLSQAPNDASAQELLESLRKARATGTRGNLEQLIITMELFVESRSRLSDFITYFLDRCSYEGATAESRAANKYTEKDVDYIDRRAHSHGDKLPKERATYYLSAAKILMDFGVSDGGRAKAYLRNFCSAMGDFCIVEKKDPEVSRTFYAEAFLVSPEWADQLSVKLTQFIMLYYAEPAEILRPRLPMAEIALEKALSMEPLQGPVVEGLLYLSSLNQRVAQEVLERSSQHPSLQQQLLRVCQQMLGESGSSPVGAAAIAQLWNRGMHEVRRRMQSCVDELSYLCSQAETLDALSDQIQRLRALNGRVPGTLDKRRIEAVSALVERVLDYTQQRAYLELESLANTIRNRVREIVEQVEASPTKLAIEFLVPYVSKLGTTIEAHFEQLRRASEPEQLVTELLIESYTPDPDTAEIELHILIRNPEGKSPASNIVLHILEATYGEYETVQTTSAVSEALAGDQRVTCLVPLRITSKAMSAEVFTLRYRLSYNTRGGRRIETEPTAHSVGLSNKSFEEIRPNPYAPYAQAAVVEEESMFYGRDDLLRRMSDLICSSPTLKSVVIYGQKRTGKSSVLFHLARSLTPPIVPVEFSLGQTASTISLPAFLYLIMQEVDTVLLRQWVEATDAPPPRPGYEELCTLPELKFHDYMGQVHRFLSQRVPGGRPRLMLLIDEFSYLYNAISAGHLPTSFMKSWKAILEKRYFGCVLVGQQVMVPFMRQFQNEFQVSEQIPLSYLDPEGAKELIETPIRIPITLETRYRGPALPLLLELTAGSPYYIQIFCNRLVQYMNRKRKRVVSDADIERVKIELVSGNNRLDEGAFDNLMSVGDQEVDPLKRRDVEAALRAVAAATKRQRYYDLNSSASAAGGPATEILNELVDREVLEREGSSRYRIRVGLFKEWLLATQ